VFSISEINNNGLFRYKNSWRKFNKLLLVDSKRYNAATKKITFQELLNQVKQLLNGNI